MEKMISDKKSIILGVLIFFSAFIAVSIKFFLDVKMPASLVYLVPETYVGPVFVFLVRKMELNQKTIR
jgi:hypothetical protein